ncbi:hypothetical protein CC85DRAFT_313492 [Cutaneotrichosporon oleaginosum]|uniref:Uncharacterized protein n=1 Tax=Cutaneotrichosporon oleaginosum TaxID=879819 RepID=A0A0J0XGG6_9TREE|nr:uncharacterized protein CC85DRAFT_313492 [Cutaneotrichosporon oleaginosum]KLT40117.1 hypothetical protein CC85DRAFT_313492 [Cutaneotrichosporon oleaginosum]TXT04755.1 hypothetical protein COLE_07574 [Cutaneotrichosporon oleaginosum]
MCHGLAILREQRRLGHGLFYDAFSASDLLKRPLYPFVPCGLLDDDISGTVDEVTRVWMVAPLGSSMVATNLILPVPPGWDRAPPSLYPAVISWLYSRCFPICTFMNEPRYESDEEGYFLFDKPVDIDQFTDDWILCESAHQLHDLVFRGRVRTLWRPHTVTCKADDQWALDSPDAPRGGAGARETDVFMLSLKADMRRVWWPAHPYDPPPTLQYINNSDSL